MKFVLPQNVLPRKASRFLFLGLAFGLSLFLTSGPANQASAQYPYYHVPPGGGNFGWTDYCARCGRQIDSGRLSAGCPYCGNGRSKHVSFLRRHAWPIGISLFILVSALLWAFARYRDKAEGIQRHATVTQYSLGVGYDGGDGVTWNDADAAQSLRVAAEQGNVQAQLNLGKRYYYGEGVPEDEVEAYKWFFLAAAQGNELARKNKRKLEKLLSAEQRASARARAVEFE